MSLRARLACISLSLVLTIGCGGQPPDKEMQQAQGALDAAQAAGADKYAAEEYTAAKTALANAHDAVDQRDYRLALDRALDSRERAQNAAKMAADGKAAARVDADRALTAAQTELNTAEQKLKAAETAKMPARLLAAPRQTIDTVHAQLQEARASFDKGDYLDVGAKAKAATASLSTALEALDTATPTAPRRRR